MIKSLAEQWKDGEIVVVDTPNYDEYQNLKKRLEIATKALKSYADEENWRTATTIINTDYFEYECSMYGLKDNGFEEAQKALKEMENVK